LLDRVGKVLLNEEICLVRMSNQNLADQEAREIVEYMRKIDIILMQISVRIFRKKSLTK